MRLSEVEGIRVKPREKFWNTVDEIGVKEFAESVDVPASRMYNWKSGNMFIPVEIIGEEAEIEAYKGRGRSKPVENPEIPVPEIPELKTRVEHSVVFSGGVPVYQASDEGLLSRFTELLEKLGDTPYQVYSRDVYEVRFPPYIYRIIQEMEGESIDAAVDESGTVQEDVRLEGDRIEASKIDELFHREKKMNLALIRGDRGKIVELMKEEREKVRKALGS